MHRNDEEREAQRLELQRRQQAAAERRQKQQEEKRAALRKKREQREKRRAAAAAQGTSAEDKKREERKEALRKIQKEAAEKARIASQMRRIAKREQSRSPRSSSELSSKLTVSEQPEGAEHSDTSDSPFSAAAAAAHTTPRPRSLAERLRTPPAADYTPRTRSDALRGSPYVAQLLGIEPDDAAFERRLTKGKKTAKKNRRRSSLLAKDGVFVDQERENEKAIEEILGTGLEEEIRELEECPDNISAEKSAAIEEKLDQLKQLLTQRQRIAREAVEAAVVEADATGFSSSDEDATPQAIAAAAAAGTDLSSKQDPLNQRQMLTKSGRPFSHSFPPPNPPGSDEEEIETAAVPTTPVHQVRKDPLTPTREATSTTATPAADDQPSATQTPAAAPPLPKRCSISPQHWVLFSALGVMAISSVVAGGLASTLDMTAPILQLLGANPGFSAALGIACVGLLVSAAMGIVLSCQRKPSCHSLLNRPHKDSKHVKQLTHE